MTTPVLRGSTAPLPGRPDGTPFGQNTLQATSPDTTLVGDLVLVVTWQGHSSPTSSALSIRAGYTQLINYFHDDGSWDGSLGIAWIIATQAGAQVYQAFDSISQTTDARTALRVYNSGTFDSSAFPTATPVSFINDADAPDPGNISTLNSTRDYLVEAIGTWFHPTGTVNCIPGAPTGYGNLISTADAGWSELALANKAVSGVSSENPGVFTDNVDATTNRGSVGGAVAILGAAGTARRAIVGQGELETPEPAPQRRAIVGSIELEVPNKKLPDTLTFLFHKHWARYRVQSEDPQPETVRRAVVTEAFLEVPDSTRRAIVTQSELELPSPPVPSGMGLGVFFSGGRPATVCEPPYVSWSTRTPDVNQDYIHGNNNVNGDWTWLTNLGGTIFGSWSGWANWLASHPNRRFLFGLGMCPWQTSCRGSSCGTNGNLLPEVVAGTHDSKFQALADYMVDNGFSGSANRPIYISPGIEMNGNYFPEAPGTNATKMQNYKLAFQRVVTLLRNRQPTANWKFQFVPQIFAYSNTINGGMWGDDWLAAIYPGDAYVDFIGATFYDGWWPPYPPATQTSRDTAWNSWELPTLNNMAAFASSHSKRMVFTEWGVFSRVDSGTGGVDVGGGDNPDFIQRCYDWFTTHDVEYVIHYDDDVGATEHISLSDQTFNFTNSSNKFKQTFSTLPHPW